MPRVFNACHLFFSLCFPCVLPVYRTIPTHRDSCTCKFMQNRTDSNRLIQIYSDYYRFMQIQTDSCILIYTHHDVCSLFSLYVGSYKLTYVRTDSHEFIENSCRFTSVQSVCCMFSGIFTVCFEGF